MENFNKWWCEKNKANLSQHSWSSELSAESAWLEQQKKIDKLKSLLLLTDPAVPFQCGTEVQLKQWGEFIKCFPEEG